MRLLAQQVQRLHQLQLALHLLIASGELRIAQSLSQALLKPAHMLFLLNGFAEISILWRAGIDW